MTATSRRQETPEPPKPEAATKKRATSDGVLAGQLFTKLAGIDAEESAELAASPETIRAKHQGRRVRAMSDASEAVKALVKRMRGEDDEGPRSE